jgi:hypothetical protein
LENRLFQEFWDLRQPRHIRSKARAIRKRFGALGVDCMDNLRIARESLSKPQLLRLLESRDELLAASQKRNKDYLAKLEEAQKALKSKDEEIEALKSRPEAAKQNSGRRSMSELSKEGKDYSVKRYFKNKNTKA